MNKVAFTDILDLHLVIREFPVIRFLSSVLSEIIIATLSSYLLYMEDLVSKQLFRNKGSFGGKAHAIISFNAERLWYSIVKISSNLALSFVTGFLITQFWISKVWQCIICYFKISKNGDSISLIVVTAINSIKHKGDYQFR